MCFSQCYKKITGWSLARLTQIMPSRLFAAATILLILDVKALSASRDDHWYFTAEEVEAAYQYQENYGGRIRHPLGGKECLLGRKEFVATYMGKEFFVPCRFITETTRHLKEMLSIGAAKYLFPLDADHAHLGVPAEVWAKKYSQLPSDQILFALLREPTLVALYHTAEHLEISDRKTGRVNEEAKAWREKRNVLGFFDGRPVQVLPPHPMGFGVGMPPGYESYGGFNFLASHRGELFLLKATGLASTLAHSIE
jgi:hypothetical protein